MVISSAAICGLPASGTNQGQAFSCGYGRLGGQTLRIGRIRRPLGCIPYMTHGCPCGWYGDAKKECHCSPFKIQKYMAKISGPLLDRIDIHLEVPSLKSS